MTVAPEIVRAFPQVDDAQRQVIGHDEGPLLVIAGPGSGKSFSLVLRTLNLLLLKKAAPAEIVLCTFTEKAAYELRDRVSSAARRIGYRDDLTDLRVGTIHSVCNQILREYRHRTRLGAGYESLDELGQLLFIFEHRREIAGLGSDPPYVAGKWTTRWSAIEGLRDYFNKITEELIDPAQLIDSGDAFLGALGAAYRAYSEMLFASNRVDFAHQQSLVHGLLESPSVSAAVVKRIRYVMVDEYQDTNYVQERVVASLASGTGNLCVVGDEDQSLYRFRGATVRNILEFPDRFPGTHVLKLTTNYRSHSRIVTAYDGWMAAFDWSNPKGRSFRFDKTISPDPKTNHANYPAVFSIWGIDERDEARRVADLISYLKDSSVISDYSQVALLLHSVRDTRSGSYTDALKARGIPAFCPRARQYFDNPIIRLMVGCFAILLGYYGGGRGQVTGRSLQLLGRYVDACLVDLARACAPPHPLSAALSGMATEIEGLKAGDSLDMRPADYFYRLIAHDPFAQATVDENQARQLAIFSQLLHSFQSFYHYTVVTHANREFLRFHFFNSFLRLLHEGGINDYEDPDQPLPVGFVQVMTIHQAKGLEFPVTIVGSLDAQLSTAKQVDRDLSRFYHRPPFEPESRITGFDRMRMHYVAFSRPERLLVLTTHVRPKDHFNAIWQGLPQWPYVEKDLLAAQSFAIHERIPVKRKFSLTGDVKVYETCPRQYQFFREYGFTPSRSAVIFFGMLVHQTIEEIHRVVLDGGLNTLDAKRIKELMDRTYQFLAQADVRYIDARAREAALRQVLDYFNQNQEEMQRVIETEVDVSVEKEAYILTGKVDLLLGGDGKLEILDFKAQRRPESSPGLLRAYEDQLCTYAHILETRYGKRADRLFLYWTGERLKGDALMEFPYRPDRVAGAGQRFDTVVGKIQAGDFKVIQPPEPKICSDCDLKTLCTSQGLIRNPDSAMAAALGAGR